MLVKTSFNNTILSFFIRPFLIRDKNFLCFEIRNFEKVNTETLFQNLTTDEISSLKNDNTFLLIDVSTEGFSYKEFEPFTQIHKLIDHYSINSKKIIYLSSNLYEDNNYNEWAKNNKIIEKINILNLNFWDWSVRCNSTYKIQYDDTIKNIEDRNYFLCLNRRLKSERILLIYKLFNSSFYNKINISFDKLNLDHFSSINEHFDIEIIKKLINLSPSVLDITNFKQNQAETFNKTLFDNSLISLVPETLYYSYNDTSMFYSEKTFKPMCFNHPIFIFGQPFINHNLTKFGYKLYDCYFDLNFDSIENIFERYSAQINFLSKLTNKLDNMTINQKKEWFDQGKEVLLHNQQVLYSQEFNKNQVAKFLKMIS